MILALRDIKNEMKTLNSTEPKILTMALRADSGFVKQRYPVRLMDEYLDHFNDMTYDYNGGFNHYTSLNAPLSGCQDPYVWEQMVDQDCQTTEFGALIDNGMFVEGAWSECFGLCDGTNWGQYGSGLKMQYKKIK